MINMGVEPFLLASAMKMVISQRLAKRLCVYCKEEIVLTELKRKKVKDFLIDIMEESEIDQIKFYHGK
jgi:type IV pilus assembly protein PilB